MLGKPLIQSRKWMANRNNLHIQYFTFFGYVWRS